MKKIFSLILVAFVCCLYATAQYEGTCGQDVKWHFDGHTLEISNISTKGLTVSMSDFDVNKHPAPWNKKKLKIRKVKIGHGIDRIGACAFAQCHDLLDIEFAGMDVRSIGWGAFYECSRLRSISLPVRTRRIEAIAFAGCRALTSLKIPDQCRVEELAFVNCSGLQMLEVSPTANIGRYAFAGEVAEGRSVRHTLSSVEVRNLPSNISPNNCNEIGLSRNCVEKFYGQNKKMLLDDVDYITSEVDSLIPQADYLHHNTYALVIGNQNYRFVPNVPYALHDARTFADYCKITLGIPAEQIHICEDATKEMILGDEMEWLNSISARGKKNLIIYYAGHGVPDPKENNKAYILPTDVRGTRPQSGIALNDLYASIGDMGFKQSTLFLDACFSGINRDNESVNEGMRGVEIEAEEATLGSGNVVVFSAAQGNETAQGFLEQGHGLFTYYLLRELQYNGGNINYGTLSDNLRRNVSRQATQLKLRKPQTPSTSASESLGDSWRSMSF